MTPNELFAAKKGVGDSIRWTNQAFDNDLNKTKGSVYWGYKQLLNQAVPEVSPLNNLYGNMRAGANALERRIPIEERNNALGLADTAGLGAGVLTGHTGPALALLGAKKLFSSQPVRSLADDALYGYSKKKSGPITPSAARIAVTQNRKPSS